jgi:DNA-binding CsgD family transcriptional regulator
MQNEIFKYFTQNELVELMNLGFKSLSCKDEGDFKNLVSSLNKLFFFENAFCGCGNLMDLLGGTAHEPDLQLYDVSFPKGFLDVYVEKKDFQADPVLWELMERLAPVNWQDVEKKHGNDDSASTLARSYNMLDGWTHGLLEPVSMNLTAFTFAGITAEHSPRVEKILEYIVPFYTEALKRFQKKDSGLVFNLTRREIEMLNWTKEGKSSWEISQILNCSKRTVDFHLENIKQKLNASTRTHAVVVALQHGIIDF